MKQVSLKSIFLSIYDRMIVKKKQEITFWVLYSFLVTFFIARLTVYFAPGFSFMHYVSKSVHIHHFVPGLFIMALVGLAALNDVHHRKPRLIASVYGLGLGWVFDEFALWFYLDDDYWVRRSYDVVIFITFLLFSLVYFLAFWKKIWMKINYLVKRKLLEKITRTNKTAI